jgi:hypothetical protein
LSAKEEPEVAMAQRAPCVRRTIADALLCPVRVSGYFRARKLLWIVQDCFPIHSYSLPGFCGLF